MMQYIIDNKEWIFSGIGIFILTAIIAIVKIKRRKEIPSNTTNLNSPQIDLNSSNSNTINWISNQTNYPKDQKTEISQEERNCLKKVYQLINSTINSVEIGLSYIKINPPKSNEEYFIEVTQNFKELTDFHDENDFLIESKINEIIKEIKDSILTLIKQQYHLNWCISSKLGFKIIDEEGIKMRDLYETIVKDKLPILKDKLSKQIYNHVNKNVP